MTRGTLADMLLRAWVASPASYYVTESGRMDLSSEGSTTVMGFATAGEDLLGLTRIAFRELQRHDPLLAAPFLVVAALCDEGTR